MYIEYKILLIYLSKWKTWQVLQIWIEFANDLEILEVSWGPCCSQRFTLSRGGEVLDVSRGAKRRDRWVSSHKRKHTHCQWTKIVGWKIHHEYWVCSFAFLAEKGRFLNHFSQTPVEIQELHHHAMLPTIPHAGPTVVADKRIQGCPSRTSLKTMAILVAVLWILKPLQFWKDVYCNCHVLVGCLVDWLWLRDSWSTEIVGWTLSLSLSVFMYIIYINSAKSLVWTLPRQTCSKLS